MILSVLIKTIKGVTGKAIIIFVRQMLAILVTLLFALGGGALTGLLMMCVARIQVAFAVYFNIKNKLGSLDRSQSLFFYAPQKKNMNITAKLARLGITKINLLQNSYNKQQNSAANHLALNTTQSIVYPEDLPKEQLFDDAFFFQVVNIPVKDLFNVLFSKNVLIWEKWGGVSPYPISLRLFYLNNSK